MSNIVDLGVNFSITKAAAKNAPEGIELSKRKGEFKEAFFSYLNWGGKYEVQEIQGENTLANKGVRKMNEWTLQKQRQETAAPLYSRIWSAVASFFVGILNCFYTPAFPTEKQEAFEAYYTQVHQSEDEGAQAVQAARAAKRAFKDAYLAASGEERENFIVNSAHAIHKATYWSLKAQGG